MNKSNLLNRDCAPDLIRISASFFVICFHLFHSLDFLSRTISFCALDIIGVTARCFFSCCVPLFLMLTGYLMNKKTLSKAYYKRIIPLLLTYFFATLTVWGYDLFRGEKVTGTDLIFNFLGFKVPYSWYVEMYLGLILLIPFLNIIYNGLKTKRQKLLLVITFLLLTNVPLFFNNWDFSNPQNFFVPETFADGNKLLPDWWTVLFPITYYFLGVYLSEFKVKLKKRYLFPLLVLQLFFVGAYNFLRTYGDVYSAHEKDSSFFSLPTMVTALLVFSFFMNIKTMKWNVRLKGIIKYLSSLTLGTFLVSSVFEKFIYVKYLSSGLPSRLRIIWLPLAVLSVFLCSMALSAVINLLCKGILKLPSLFKKKAEN